MLQAFFDNNAKIWQYVLVWLGFALLQALTFSTFTDMPFSAVLTDSAIHSVLYALLGILLWSVIRYGKFGSLTVYQQIINYSALTLLVLAVSVGGGYWLDTALIGDKLSIIFLKLIYLRAFITLLIFLIAIQFFRFTTLKSNEIDELNYDLEPIAEVVEPVQGNDILERIAVKSGTKIHVIMIPEVIFLQADGDYVQIFTSQGKYLKEQTMKYFEEHLPENQFVRVHRSCIVNIEAISRIELYDKQNQQLMLKDGHKVKVSQAGYKALRMKLNL